MANSFLSIEKLTQRYPDGKGGEFTVFENASFGIEKGEFVCILGHSGCGKSTELRPYFRTGSLLTLGGHFPSHIFKSLFWGFVADA
jgi:ABC-type glutathione transport system ATPase component